MANKGNKTWAQIKHSVEARIQASTLSELEQEVHDAKLSLWGEDKPEEFEKMCLYITLWKDLTAKGYCQIQRRTHAWLKLTTKSIAHNTQLIRNALKPWAMRQIQLGDSTDWKNAASATRFSKLIKDTNLWIDSTDFPLVGKRSTKRKDESWSYKCNSPGRRFQVICDANRRIRKVWGGYSPKVYDGAFLEITREWFEEKLKGGVIVADTHYAYGRDNIRDPKFYVPVPKPPKRKKDDTMVNLSVLTKEQQAKNKAIRQARARVESPFGEVKQKWAALSSPWGESESQLDSLVFLAFGIHNFELE